MNYYILPKDGKIAEIKLYPQHPGEPWVLIPKERAFRVTIGELLTWYTGSFERIPNQKLVEMGIRQSVSNKKAGVRT